MPGLVKKFLSDAEMDAMAGQQQPSPQPTKKVLSDAEMDALDSGQPEQASPQPGPGGFTGFLQGVAEPIEKYFGAPMRSAEKAGIEAFQNTNVPGVLSPLKYTGYGQARGLLAGAKAFGKQFGSDPNEAPSLQQVGQAAGVSDKPLIDGLVNIPRSSAAGFGIDIASQAAIPVGEIAGGIAKGAGYAAEGAAKIAPKLSNFFGVSPELTRAYVADVKGANALISKYGKDIASASDAVKNKINMAIQGFKGSMNAKISTALEHAAPEASVDISEVLNHLDGAASKLNPKLRAEESSQISKLKTKIKSVVEQGPSGEMLVTPKDAFEIKNILQEEAKGAYMKGGQIFVNPSSPILQNAAKGAASKARKLLNDAIPDIAEANNSLAGLHRIEDTLTRGMLKEGSSEAGLIRAGKEGTREAKALGNISKITGKDLTGEAKNLAGMKGFSDVHLTNPAASRSVIAGGMGYLLGHAPGAVVATALTSPAAFKAAINAGSISADVIKQIAGLPGVAQLTPEVIEDVYRGLVGLNQAQKGLLKQ